MTKDELFQQLTAGGLFPIPVEGGIEADDVAGMLFLGEVTGFIEAATALGSRCVFVASKVLDEADFLHPDEAQEFGDNHTAEEIPALLELTALQPALNEFKERLAEHCAHRMWVQMPGAKLELIVRAAWWEKFSNLRDEAVEAIKRKRDSVWAEREEEDKRRADELLVRLRAFIDDAEFVKLPTQVAMQAYAVEQVPELEKLGDKTLRAEIRALDGKIKAKGLRTKKTTPATPPAPKAES
jgi:hypothetical protein